MDRRLISAAEFRAMAKKNAPASDFDNIIVFKAGLSGLAPGMKAHVGEFKADDATRTIPFVLSTAKIDREGDSLAVGGWDLTGYKNNPVVLWAHDHSALPVGKALITVVDGPVLKALDQFVGPDIYPFANTVYQMTRGGYINACSVGFLPTEWEMSETGVNFLSQALLEHSICPVPANDDALVIARSKGIDVAPLKAWAEKTLDMMKRGDTLMRKEIERLRAQTDPTGRKVFSVLGELRLDDEEIVVDGLPIVPSRRAIRRADRVSQRGEIAQLVADLKGAKTPRRAAPKRRAALVRAVSETPEAASLATITSVLADVVTVLPEALASAETLLEDPASADPEALTMLVSACVDAMEKLSVVAEGAQALIAAALGPVESADVGGRAARFDALRSFVAVVGKAGARHSAADVALLQDAHDQLVALGAACKTDASADEVGIEDDADTRALVRAVAELAVEEAVMRATGRLR